MRGDREYVNIPGNKMHELPPLLVRRVPDGPPVDMTSAFLEAEEMLPEVDVEEALLERRRFDLALTLAEQYRGLIAHWQWGESIVECGSGNAKSLFRSESALRDPAAPRRLAACGPPAVLSICWRIRKVTAPGVALQTAVGLQLTFRKAAPAYRLLHQRIPVLPESIH